MKKSKTEKIRKQGSGLLVASPFLLPSLIGLMIFSLMPLIISGLISLTDWNGLDQLMQPGFFQEHFIGFENYKTILTTPEFWKTLGNTAEYIVLYGTFKKVISTVVMLPMLLPTITYGFAIIYSLGKQGLITKLLGRQIVNIYGIGGLLIGYVIYTLPTAFMLINNTMKFIDKKFMIVSRLMGDSRLKGFLSTVLTPLASTLAVAFIQSFTLSFTDYGIPAALAGNIDLLSTRLYNEMLGSLPNFYTGSAVSVLMLLPSVLSIILITVLNQYNIRYTKISHVELSQNRGRDGVYPEAKMLSVEENMARALTIRWSDYDLAKAVNY